MDLPRLDPPDPENVQSFVFPALWATKDAKRLMDGVSALFPLIAPGVHFSDNFLTWGRNNSMLDDARFVEAWRSNCENDADRGIIWRRYILACQAFHCVQLEGDFVECGAYTGAGIKTVIDYLGGTEFPRTAWLYDLFEHDASFNHPKLELHKEGLYERVIKKFETYPQVKVCRGLIPKVFEAGAPERIAYLHIDLNNADAELASLEVLFDRLVPGGVLILDDYEWSGPYRAQKIREDQWLESRGYRVTPLPTGQGLLIKR